MFHWANPKKTKQDAALFRIAREERLRAVQNGLQIVEDAALKERRANRDQEIFRMAREKKTQIENTEINYSSSQSQEFPSRKESSWSWSMWARRWPS